MRSKIGQPGFTLLELLVVVSIGSILLAVAIPSFSTIVQNNRRTGYVNELVGAFTYARAQAATLRRPVTICRSTAPLAATPACAAANGGSGWADGWIVFIDIANNGTFDSAADTVLLVHEPIVANQTSFCGETNVAHTITFSKTGMSNRAGAIAYCDARSAAQGRNITLNLGGRATSGALATGNTCNRSTATPPVCT